MNRNRRLPLEIARCMAGAGLVAVLSSCTFLMPIGIGMSSAVPKAGWPAGRVSPGSRVTVHVQDGSVIAGRLEQAGPIEGAAYREWQEKTFPGWAERWEVCLALGEPAELHLRSGDRLRGTFAEVDRQSVTVSVQGNDHRVPMEQWERLDMNGDCSATPELVTAIQGQEWPLPPLLLAIRTREGEMAEIRSDEVVRTTVPATGRRLGRALFRGLVVDGAIASVVFFYFLVNPPQISVGF